MTTPLTWDRWKDLLLPHGWTEIYGCVLQSPLSPGGTSVQLVHVNDMTNAAYLLTSYFISVTEDAELAAMKAGGYRRWDVSERDAIATVVGKIRTKICGKAAGQ